MNVCKWGDRDNVSELSVCVRVREKQREAEKRRERNAV
jgi:hypothetical protein